MIARAGHGAERGKPLQQRNETEKPEMPKYAFAAILPLVAIAAPAAAQNTTAEPPVIAVPPPTTKTETPPTTSTPTPSTAPPATTDPAPAPVVVVPAPAPATPEPITIDPDAAYPNGFADPDDPFGNDMSLAYREQSGFPWGLLGLLGLFGLIPLFRDRGGRRVVYVERDESPPRRVVREERIDDRP